MSRAELADLVEETGARSAMKLRFQARKRGLNPTKEDIAAVVSSLGEKQIFAPLQPSRGKTAADDVARRFMADLADFKETPSGQSKYFLIVIDVFTREIATASLPNKEQDSVRPVLKRLLGDLGAERGGFAELSTDAGTEFQGSVDTMLQSRQIAHRTKPSTMSKNDLAVVDRAIQSVKKRIAMILARNPGDWVQALRTATEQYNADFHSTVRDAPGEVADNPKLMFMAMKDNAAKYKHNEEHLAKRKALFEELGAFRAPKPEAAKNVFKRGFKATYQDKENVVRFEGSKVVGSGGTALDQKLLMPVSRDSTAARSSFEFTDAQARRKRDILSQEGFLDKLNENIPQEGRIAMTALGKLMRKDFPYQETMTKARIQGLGSLAVAIRLYPELYSIEEGELFVRRVQD